MGKVLITNWQRKLLEITSKDQFITKTFFLTGGTVLSYFYLQHRFSEDLDFFSETEYSSEQLLVSIKTISKILKPKKIEQQKLNNQDVFYFHFDSQNKVKIDFAYFPFPHFGKFGKINNLKVSSMEDIAVNKLQAIISRKRARDYIDLKLSIERLGWNLSDLRKNYRLKYDFYLGPDQLATSFTNVTEASDLPLFLGDTDFEEVEKFFLLWASQLKKEVLK